MENNLKTVNQQGNEQLWSKRVMDCRASSLTVEKWCSENDIKVSTFYAWQRKLFQKATQHQKFTEISVAELKESPTTAPKIIATVTINGVKAEIFAGSSERDIKTLIRGLKLC